MSVYFMAQIAMRDPDTYAKYLAEAGAVFSQYQGEYLAVDEKPEILEGNWDYSRAVLIRFPDKESFRAWYTSSEYQKILQHRLGGARCDTILIEGK